ncbi:MAG TPA: hypothetical protein VE287_07505 [Actinopolymorphaceae bacterium]|nr:hypothetical protein [Actinopolymorphaceae bacterium]
MRTNVWTGIATFAFCLLLIGSVFGDRPDEHAGLSLFDDQAKSPDLLDGVTFPPGSPCLSLVLQADTLMRRITELDGGSVSANYWASSGFAEFADIEANLHRLGCDATPPTPPSDLDRGRVRVE